MLTALFIIPLATLTIIYFVYASLSKAYGVSTDYTGFGFSVIQRTIKMITVASFNVTLAYSALL